MGSATGEDGYSGTVKVLGPHLTKETRITHEGYFTSLNGVGVTTSGGGARSSAADVDAVQFLLLSGNLESGTITMYGIKNS